MDMCVSIRRDTMRDLRAVVLKFYHKSDKDNNTELTDLYKVTDSFLYPTLYSYLNCVSDRWSKLRLTPQYEG